MGTTRANLMAWNDALFLTPAAAQSRADGKRLWPQTLPGVVAMAIAGDKAVVAAPARGEKGVLRVVSLADGSMLAEQPLPAAPVFDGVAVAGGRIYVSQVDGCVACFDRQP
jgi:hypothetical protein